MKTYNQYINESVRDKMTPKSEEDIKKSLKSLGPYDKMYKAIKHGILSIVKDIIESGIDLTKNVGGGTSAGSSFVTAAVECGKLDILEFLLDNGCSLRDGTDDWFLHMAIKEGHYDMAKFFYDRGATVSEDVEDNYFEIAVDYNNLDLVKLVLDCGYDHFEEDWMNDTLLSDNTDPEIIKLIMKESQYAREYIEKMYNDYKKGVDILEKYVQYENL